MAKPVFYRQCRLAKPHAGGEFVQIGWIPEKFAVVGKTIRLRADAAWDDGWVVTTAGGRRLAAADVPDFHELSKAHLRATGDAETAT
jgi:hypothetical protein